RGESLGSCSVQDAGWPVHRPVLVQVAPASHSPQEPPHPSLPQLRPEQAGVQDLERYSSTKVKSVSTRASYPPPSQLALRNDVPLTMTSLPRPAINAGPPESPLHVPCRESPTSNTLSLITDN